MITGMIRRNSKLGLVVITLFCTISGADGKSVASPAAGSANIVFMIGEDEYKTWETLPQFARTELAPRGVHFTIVLEDARRKNHFPGIAEALKTADLLVLSVRRRLPPKDELDAVRAYLNAGHPLVAIRTACHAFSPSLNATAANAPHEPARDSWVEFDPQVLGGHYIGHWGNTPKTSITVATRAESSTILNGVNVAQLVGNGSLYRVRPLDAACEPILIGRIPGKDPEPVAWTRRYGPGHARVFYTSLGHPDDFAEPAFRRLLLNAIAWASHRPTL